MHSIRMWAVFAVLIASPGQADFDAAAAFGARESVSDLHLSPDGQSVAYLSPMKGQGSVLYTLAIKPGAKPVAAVSASGQDDQLQQCEWVANDRLTCNVFGYVTTADQRSYFTRALAIDADGKNLRVLSDRLNPFSRGAYALYGGDTIARMPETGAILMSRLTIPDEHVGTRLATSQEGLRVDRVDTRTGAATTIESPNRLAESYIANDAGQVRIMEARAPRKGGYDTPVADFFFRRSERGKWESLSSWEAMQHQGFLPQAVVGDTVYGLAPKDGVLAAWSMPLDGSLERTLLYAAPGVDVGGFQRFGYHERVVGVHYADDYHHTEYTDPALKALMTALAKAIPGNLAVSPVDASLDERKLLLFAGSDRDPGVYYLFDRDARKLETFLVVRSALEGVALGAMQPIDYPARDGVRIPGYLTLPPGQESAKGLPAIVLPHGGPEARDVWGFDWLAQFYAHQGYVVLQPNFRGSAGYGEAWFQKNGFQSWRTAIQDVIDGAKWLAETGVADPKRIAIVGWSYGGYAALQAAITEPEVFRAVVAIAPVTDLEMLKETRRRWTDYYILGDFIGSGPHVREGSPAFNAARLRSPVLIFHGDEDRNVPIEQGQRMEDALRGSPVRHEFVVYPGLDHQLRDSAARTDLLRRSDEFLRKILMP